MSSAKRQQTQPEVRILLIKTLPSMKQLLIGSWLLAHRCAVRYSHYYYLLYGIPRNKHEVRT